jgi:hypothetical protein
LQHIETVIEEKLIRQKKYAMIRLTRKLQSKWIMLITMLKYLNRINDYGHEIKRGLVHMFRKENAGGLIIRVMSLWYQRWLFRKYQLGFERVKKSRGRLVIGVRIMKKNMVMKKLKWFLTECKPRPVMATVVHRFIKNVHFLQRIYHNFCKCKSARIHSIMRIWDRYEASYIKKKKLREKKEKVLVGKSTSFEALDIDFKLKLEMEKQDEKWKVADSKMEDQLMMVAATGKLKRASNADAIKKLLCSTIKQSMQRVATYSSRADASTFHVNASCIASTSTSRRRAHRRTPNSY